MQPDARNRLNLRFASSLNVPLCFGDPVKCIKQSSSSLSSSSKLYLLNSASLKESLPFFACKSTMVPTNASKGLVYTCRSLDIPINYLFRKILQKIWSIFADLSEKWFWLLWCVSRSDAKKLASHATKTRKTWLAASLQW